MATVNFGEVVSDARGSVGAVTYSRNPFGAYARARVTPQQPNNAKQLAQRARMGTVSAAWSGLGLPQREAWSQWAKQFVRPRRLSHKAGLAGQQGYVSVNLRLLSNGLALQAAPPVRFEPEYLADLTGFQLNGPVLFPLQLVIGFRELVVNDSYVQVWGTPPYPAGVSFPTPLRRLVGLYPGFGLNTLDVTAKWSDVFTSAIGVGPWKITLWANVIGAASGVRSPMLRVDLPEFDAALAVIGLEDLTALGTETGAVMLVET